jgi:hypothetical protein
VSKVTKHEYIELHVKFFTALFFTGIFVICSAFIAAARTPPVRITILLLQLLSSIGALYGIWYTTSIMENGYPRKLFERLHGEFSLPALTKCSGFGSASTDGGKEA